MLLGFLQDLLFFCLGLLISELDELEEELEDCRRRRTAPEDVTTTEEEEEEVEAAVTDDGVVEDVIIEVLDLVAIRLFTDPPPLMAEAILLTI